MPSSQFFFPEEPDANNIISILENTYTRFQSVEQARWNESNIDVRFWAGDQDYVYSYFQFAPNYGWKKFFFNIIQQPCNMVTGYQRQHRKSIGVIPVENSDQRTADQLTNVMQYAHTKGFILEKFSDACEQSVTSGMVLLQPFLSYDKDPINGDVELKIWEYNSFMVDPYFRDPSMSDANFVWCQKYLSKKEAILQFPEHRDLIQRMSGYSSRDARFYFLPENYNIARNDLLVLSHYWYKSNRMKKMLYNRETGETTDFHDTDENMKEYISVFDNLEIIEVEIPTWKVAVILNKNVLYVGDNPLGFDECPFVPVFWNYDPYLAQYNLRVRSLVRSLRDINFLFNRRIILNHDISESSLNTGWMYLEDSVANEENMMHTGQGKNIVVKDSAKEFPPQKIIPNAVPPSDIQLADQLFQLIYPISGINEELLGAAQDSKAGITEMLRQGAGLVTLQKYFDQWDRSLKQLGMLNLRIIQNKWMPFKVSRILGEQPTEQFFSKNFQQYDVLPAEGLNTTVQRNEAFAQMLDFQQLTGIQIPPSLLLKYATLQGKDELIEALEQQQQMQNEIMQQQQMLEMAKLEGELENLRANTAEKLAMARERTGRTKSNVGLFEERISEVSQNRARALKERVSALKELLDTMHLYGEYETLYGSQQIQAMDSNLKMQEEVDEVEGRIDAAQDRNMVQASATDLTQNFQQFLGGGQQYGQIR